MRIQLVSDLHLEFAPLNIMNEGNTDVLILSGDICVAQYFRRGPASPKKTIADEWRVFFENCANEFSYVIYVLGNHEHYSGRFDDTVETLRMALCDLPNIYILDQTHVDIGDIQFFGSTLWTDFNDGMWSAKLAVKGALNDYSCIQRNKKGLYRKLSPDDTELYHRQTLVNLDHHVRQHDKIVFVGHHAPSWRSIEPKYQTAGLLNYGYYSNLDNWIADRPQIKLWTHGHVHSSHDYMIADTRIACNPRGYATPSGKNENELFDPNKVFEV